MASVDAVDRILISGLTRAWACTACCPRSRCAPQPFEVDLELLVDLAPAGASDDARRHRRLRRGVRGGEPRSSRRSTTSCSSGSRRASPRCAAPIRACQGVVVEVRKLRPAGAGPARLRRACASNGERARLPRARLEPRRPRSRTCSSRSTRSPARTDVEVVAVSRVYETAPVGGPPQDAYLNAVVAIDTDARPARAARARAARSSATRSACAPNAGARARSTSTCCSYDDVAARRSRPHHPAPADVGARLRAGAAARRRARPRRRRRRPGKACREAAVTLRIPWTEQTAHRRPDRPRARGHDDRARPARAGLDRGRGRRPRARRARRPRRRPRASASRPRSVSDVGARRRARDRRHARPRDRAGRCSRPSPSIEPGALVVHLAGSLGSTCSRAARARGPACGSARCTRCSRSRRRRSALERLARRVGRGRGRSAVAEHRARRSGCARSTLADADRGRYHAAAVVASNHLVALLGQVERLRRRVRRAVRGVRAARALVGAERVRARPGRRAHRARSPGATSRPSSSTSRRSTPPSATRTARWPARPPGSPAAATPASTGCSATSATPPASPPTPPTEPRPHAGTRSSAAPRIAPTIDRSVPPVRTREGRNRARPRHAPRRDDRRPPRRVRSRARRRPARRARAHDGLPARGPPVADAGGPRGGRLRRRHDLREPAAVRRERGPRPLPARSLRRPRAVRGGGRRLRVRAVGRRDVPERPPLTTVHVAELTADLCGAARPDPLRRRHHRRREAVLDRRAVRGVLRAQGRQQLAVITRMAEDLNLPVEVVGCPIVREPDGLALSSRNAYLSPADRQAALVLSRALRAAAAAIVAGERDARRARAARPRDGRRRSRASRSSTSRCATRTSCRAMPALDGRRAARARGARRRDPADRQRDRPDRRRGRRRPTSASSAPTRAP